jgi:hypothetical protein
MMENMIKLFGTEQSVLELQELLSRKSRAPQRELIVLSHLMSTFESIGVKYIQPFAFKVESDHRSTHRLIFLTNHPKGYERMKGIMADSGTETNGGLPYPCYVENPTLGSLDLFPINRTAELAKALALAYAGQTLSVQQIFERHSRGKPFLPNDYRDAVQHLEQEERVGTLPPESNRPMHKGKRSMSLSTIVIFPGGKT